jgi:hypothetical protein
LKNEKAARLKTWRDTFQNVLSSRLLPSSSHRMISTLHPCRLKHLGRSRWEHSSFGPLLTSLGVRFLTLSRKFETSHHSRVWLAGAPRGSESLAARDGRWRDVWPVSLLSLVLTLYSRVQDGCPSQCNACRVTTRKWRLQGMEYEDTSTESVRFRTLLRPSTLPKEH